jgi:formylmethanofuran dehydrogenase subunit E
LEGCLFARLAGSDFYHHKARDANPKQEAMTHPFRCPICKKPTPRLSHRSTDGKLVCLWCLPKKDVDRYPRGWRERALKGLEARR